MVRSRQLSTASARSGVIRLTVTAVEREPDADGAQRLVALHGVNAGRPWRLTMHDALAAFGTGRYAFEVVFEGERRRAEVLGTDGARRLYAPSAVRGDLIDALPDWRELAQDRDGASQARQGAGATAAASGPTA